MLDVFNGLSIFVVGLNDVSHWAVIVMLTMSISIISIILAIKK